MARLTNSFSRLSDLVLDECADLPPSIVERRSVALSPNQSRAYKALEDACILYVKEGKPITAVNEGVLRLKLIQVASGAVYGPDKEINIIDASPRIAELHSIIEECREKIIIFAPLTSVLHLLKKELSKYSVEIVNGEVSAKDRAEIFRRFQDEKDPRILIADPGTMAHGLDVSSGYLHHMVCSYGQDRVVFASERSHKQARTNSDHCCGSIGGDAN